MGQAGSDHMDRQGQRRRPSPPREALGCRGHMVPAQGGMGCRGHLGQAGSEEAWGAGATRDRQGHSPNRRQARATNQKRTWGMGSPFSNEHALLL